MQPFDPPERVEKVSERRASASGFEELYERSRNRLAGQLFALTGDWQGSFDFVQEAFVRTWERWERVSDYDSPEAYVRRVAFNLAKSHWRRFRRVLYTPAADSAEGAVDPDSHIDLVVALRLLSLREREAIVLHYLADEPIDQIAREMKVPTGTVKSWLSRGRSRLAEHLAIHEPEELTPHE